MARAPLGANLLDPNAEPDSVVVGARVPAVFRDALEELARRRERTVSGELRLALAKHLERELSAAA